MTHPTCARERRPNASSVSASPLNTEADRAALSRQAEAELDALRDAYLSVTCIHNLLLLARGSRNEESGFNVPEVRTLVALVGAEFERRLQSAKATVALLQSLPVV